MAAAMLPPRRHPRPFGTPFILVLCVARMAGIAQAQALPAQDAAADAFQRRAFDNVPFVPIGQFQIRTARRKNLVGQIEATGAYFWNIRRV